MIWAVGRKLGPEITDVLAICGRKLRAECDAGQPQVQVGRQVAKVRKVHNLVWKAGETIDEADWPSRLEAVVTAQMCAVSECE